MKPEPPASQATSKWRPNVSRSLVDQDPGDLRRERGCDPPLGGQHCLLADCVDAGAREGVPESVTVVEHEQREDSMLRREGLEAAHSSASICTASEASPVPVLSPVICFHSLNLPVITKAN